MRECDSTSDLDSRLTLNLHDLGHMMRFLFDGKASQKRILLILYKAGGMTQRELTEKLKIQPGSASEVLGKLESAGLILRTQSQTDRRTADIELTAYGRSQAEEAIDRRKVRQKEMFSCLTVEEKETLLALAEKLNQDLRHRCREHEKEGGSDHPRLRGSHGDHHCN